MEIGPIFRSMARNKTGVGLLVFEIAITMAIVLNAATLIMDNKQRVEIPTGLDEEHILEVGFTAYSEQANDVFFFDQLVDRDLAALQALPGVLAASSISPTPLQGGGSSSQRKPVAADSARLVRCPQYWVDPQFLETLGLELVEGRNFTAQDMPPVRNPDDPIPSDMPPRPVIVTEDLADALFPDGNALGQMIAYDDSSRHDQIIGVVRYMFTPYDMGKSGMETRILFQPYRRGDASYKAYLVRIQPDNMDALYETIDSTLMQIDGRRIIDITPLTEIKKGGLSINLFVVKILTAMMFLLIGVTAIGIFGLTSFAVAGRTRQIGTRRALGATKTDIVRYFLVENSIMTLMGVSLGSGLAVLLNGVIVKATDGTPLDAVAILIGVVSLWAVGVLAALIPSLRAASVPPVVATRAT